MKTEYGYMQLWRETGVDIDGYHATRHSVHTDLIHQSLNWHLKNKSGPQPVIAKNDAQS